jgi:lipoprotein-releasing system permease protein
MKLRFVLFVAARYFKPKRKERKTAFSVFSVLGISVGVMTLVVVLGVMNGFQLSFIRPTLEVMSYHLQITPRGRETLPAAVLRKLEQDPSIAAVVPFHDMQAIVGLDRACVVRGVSLPAVERDRGFQEAFYPEYDRPGAAVLSPPGSVALGVELASQIGAYVGNTVNLATISGKEINSFSPAGRDLRVTGIFKTGFYNIDLNWAFVSLETAESLENDAELTYGVKLRNRFRDVPALDLIQETLREHGIDISEQAAEVESWRDFNRVFFGALATEKSTMGLLIGLIFLVVGFNIYYSLRRSVNEKLEEIATLKAIGSSVSTLQSIFLFEGFMVGVIGSFVGSAAGLLLTAYINEFFRFIETVANGWLIPLVEGFLPDEASLPPVSIFSPAVFYIDSIPVYVYLREVFLIAFFALTSASLAAYLASRGAASAKPSVILRYE